VKELGYVLAERGLGQTPLRILLGTVLPNVLPIVAVFALLDIGLATLAGATLSFLGLGIRPPEAEWGAMVSLGLQYPTEWWISVFPGVALISFVVGLNLYGEVLEKRLGGAPGGVR
jgi:peptide/nickel transport system permease protein